MLWTGNGWKVELLLKHRLAAPLTAGRSIGLAPFKPGTLATKPIPDSRLGPYKQWIRGVVFNFPAQPPNVGAQNLGFAEILFTPNPSQDRPAITTLSLCWIKVDINLNSMGVTWISLPFRLALRPARSTTAVPLKPMRGL